MKAPGLSATFYQVWSIISKSLINFYIVHFTRQQFSSTKKYVEKITEWPCLQLIPGGVQQQHGAAGLVGPPGGGSEAAKFKLWVKSKGFHLGPPIGHPDSGKMDHDKILYLPTGTDKVSEQRSNYSRF